MGILVTEDISKEIREVSDAVIRSEVFNHNGVDLEIDWHLEPVYDGKGEDRELVCFVETPELQEVSTIFDEFFRANDCGYSVTSLGNSKIKQTFKDSTDTETMPSDTETVSELASRAFSRNMSVLNGKGQVTSEQAESYQKYLIGLATADISTFEHYMKRWSSFYFQSPKPNAKDIRAFIDSEKQEIAGKLDG